MNTVVNIPSSTPHLNAPEGAPAQGLGTQSSTTDRRTAPEQHSLFVPMLLAAVALLGWLGFQTQQLFSERDALKVAYASQQQTVDNAGKLRASLDALAADTQRMADRGNPNAKLLVDELRKRGITINPAAGNPALAGPVPEH